VAPTKVIALPTSDTTIAIKHGITLNMNVQNTFYLFDIPNSLYRSNSIVFLHGSKHSGIVQITDTFVIVLPI